MLDALVEQLHPTLHNAGDNISDLVCT